ncbi:MAG: alpha/beta hydrolase [Kofleriaceae bacterium]|nr:alpha/beta hydrolase [Kofleriaceae bacterium]
MPARLNREVIGPADAGRHLLMTHGFFGSGGNWRSIARKVHTARPDWGIVLVDLRQHGRSDAGEPPHTLAACADDIRALVDEMPTIAALAGHSFGGKVVLAARAHMPPTLQQTWVFDASPSPRSPDEENPANTVTRILSLLERLPRRWAKRDDFIAAIVADGHGLPLAQWLAMNLVPDGDAMSIRFDFVALREMLLDYCRQDLWSIALDPKLPGEVRLVIAARSATVSDEDRARLAAPDLPPHLKVHTIDAGHWLHIEAPATVVDLLTAHLPTSLR